MEAPVIRVEKLGKQYRLGEVERYKTLRDSIARAFRRPWRRRATPEPRTLWALRDLSFSVHQGEVVGVVGRNGAGKSTLLKIVSRTTGPTTGYVEVAGRTGSLLEVGTGFHPELTGRENVFLNGAILGMRRKDIQQKFDAIAAFAEVEDFLDTPVKRYSSGMYMRLAFSVAAHLEPDILIVDEVLAVGDSKFQEKCLGRMGEVANSGRTVLFVSHNMPAVLRLCSKALLLESGRGVQFGEVRSVVNAYLGGAQHGGAERSWPNPELAPGDATARLAAVRVHNGVGEPTTCHDIQCPIHVEVDFWNLKAGAVLVPNLHFVNGDGIHVFATATNHDESACGLAFWTHRATCIVPGNLLAAGRFYVTANISSIRPESIVHASEPDAVVIDVEDTGGARGSYSRAWPGVVRPVLPWTIREINAATDKTSRQSPPQVTRLGTL